jgi:hypothetical protein
VNGARIARPLVWIFNVVGTVDLLAAIALATIYGAPDFMGPAYWIPAFWVPALLVTHYLTFVALAERKMSILTGLPSTIGSDKEARPCDS